METFNEFRQKEGLGTLTEVLSHYGVMGMRWGVRRSDKEIARARGRRKKEGKPVTKTSEDAERAKVSAKKAKKGGVKALTNKELQDLNQRMNLEKQYSKLTDRPSKAAKGLKFVKALVDVGKTANEVNNFINSPMGKQISGQMEKKTKTAKELNELRKGYQGP